MRENLFCYAQFASWKLKRTSVSLESAHTLSFTMYFRRFLSSPHHFSPYGAHISKKITLWSSQIFNKSISVKKIGYLIQSIPLFDVFYSRRVTKVIHFSQHSSVFPSFLLRTQGVGTLK